MNLLVVAATELEIKPFMQSNNFADVLITGVGIPSSVFHLTNKLAAKKYDLAMPACIARSYFFNAKYASPRW